LTVAVLYCDEGRNAPYVKLKAAGEDLDLWGVSRDARKYDGPHTVVAHPPCRNWSKLSYLAKDDDSDCALRAIDQVRKFGGVLEHPASSRLWLQINLPSGHRDDFGGRRITLNQVEWGHVARKPTWLYLVGVCSPGPMPPPREPTHWCSGFRTAGKSYSPAYYKQRGSAVPLGIKVCSAQQRRRTPPLFAEYLVRLARAAAEARRAA
jgi:hypothetical protein